MSECAIPSCEVFARPGQLMCLPHWRMVPRHQQAAVNRTWRNIRQDRDAYVDARQAAIDSVQAEISQIERTLFDV